MKTSLQIGTGFAAIAAFVAATELLPMVGGLVCMLLAVAFMIAGLALGHKLPLALRIFATGLFFYYGYSMCLIGRTMGPGISAYTFGAAIGMFFLFGLLPALSLVRVWRPALGISLIALLFPTSLGVALLVAGIEEHLFVRKHRETGVGPTARWTVSNHWLSYDRETQKLNGSD